MATIDEPLPGASESELDEKSLIGHVSNRRMIERLSGGRLIGFFFSAAVNLGMLVALVQWPWMFDASQIFIVTALVAGAHAIFAMAVSGFRFPVSVKLALGLGHAVACVWALASVGAAPIIRFQGVDIATLFLFPFVTILITVGGVAVSRLAGFHRGKIFRVADVMIFITAIAILLPITLRIVPESQFLKLVSLDSIGASVFYAMSIGGWSLVVMNLFVPILPEAGSWKNSLANSHRLVSIFCHHQLESLSFRFHRGFMDLAVRLTRG